MRLPALDDVLDNLADAIRWIVGITRRWPLSAWLVHVSLFCLLSYFLLDRPVARFFKAHVHGDIEGFFKTITQFGLAGIYLIPAGLAWIYCRWRLRQAVYHANAIGFFFLSIASSGLFVNGVKALVGRYRPRYLFDDGLYGFDPFTTHWGMNSFPSGHSQAAFATMAALAVLVPRYNILWFVIATWIAASRVVTSVHYLSDTVMGSYLGIAGVVLLHRLYLARNIDLRLR